MVVGERIRPTVDEAIRSTDKLILCCSKYSLTSTWVDREVQAALLKEDRHGDTVLVPLMLDDTLMDWQTDTAYEVRQRLAADFQGWDKDNAKYEAQLERIVQALRRKADESGSGSV